MPSSSANTVNDRPRINPTAALLLGILAASTSSIFVRFAQVEASSLVIAAARMIFATLILLPIFLVSQRRNPHHYSAREVRFGLLAGGFLALHFATWITSLEFTSVASSVALVQTSPLFVAALSPLLLREFPARSVILGMLIALTGSLFIAVGDACFQAGNFACPPLADFVTGGALKGDLLALAGALTGALYLIFGREIRSAVPLIPYIFLVYGTAASGLLFAVLLTGQNLVAYSPATFLWFLLLALVPQLFAHSTYNWALAYLPATVVSVSLLGEPVAATILAVLFLNEIPSGWRIVGAILVIIGIAISILQSSTRE
jgi:drug/metabolite transporter (DMT)-like permease